MGSGTVLTPDGSQTAIAMPPHRRRGLAPAFEASTGAALHGAPEPARSAL